MSSLSISKGSAQPELAEKKTLIDLFRETVQTYPCKEACIFENQKVTYSELDERSNAITAQLQQSGITSGVIVGVYLPRGIDLHVSILGILKSGAAYIPFDIETPKDRIESVCQDYGISTCLSFESFQNPIQVISPTQSSEKNEMNLAKPDDLAYVIFTSGSTGKPKGIPIRQNQISLLIQSENSVLQVQHTDRIYQGFSVSFDMWFEETWLSYLVGATLIIADAKTAKSIDELHHFLAKNQVSILHAVPSLLSLLNPEIPSLRLVNSGGEACNQNIVQKWYHRDRLFFNSYGPTETTVSSCMIPLHPGDAISVGKPLPFYDMAVVNEHLEIVPIGEEGELVISGPCLSEGYLNRPDLTAKAFLIKSDSLKEMQGERIYLTGDFARMNEAGEFYIVGRKDDQIKIRGYRIELGEIEAQLNTLPIIKQAVVCVKKWNNLDQLVAYIIPNNDTNVDESALRQELGKQLPSYMVPNYFEVVEAFDFLTSGKVDKKKLPLPKAFDQIPTSKKFENPILQIIQNIFPSQEIKIQADFFENLGGYSLIAAQFVSQIRGIKGFEKVSIMDVYEHRPIGKLLDFWEKEKLTEVPQQTDFNPSTRNYYICGLSQLIALFFIFGIVAAQLFIPFLGYYIAVNELESHLIPLIFAVILYCTVIPMSVILIWLIKKLIIGPLKEGDYPLWGKVYFKWWLQKRLYSLIPKEVLGNTPLYADLIRAFGVKIKTKNQLSNFEMGVEELIEIGENVTISSKSVLQNAWVEQGKLKLRKIYIDDDAYVGTSSIVSGDCHLEKGCELKDLSHLEAGKRMGHHEIFEGSPAAYTGKKEDYLYPKEPAQRTRLSYYLSYLVLVFLFPMLVLIPLVPSIMSLYYLDEQADWYSFYYLFKTPIFALMYIILFLGEVILLTRIFQKDLTPGQYSIYNPVYVKKWFTDQLFSLSLLVIKPIFATVYISWVYRALGAKVGDNTEISTATNVSHSLLEIGQESFIADDVSIGETEIRNQELSIATTRIGNRSFVGNSALIPQGYQLGDGMLIGVVSVPPQPEQLRLEQAKDWFGSPARPLPNREIISNYPPSLTYSPSNARKIARGIVEFIRILIPQSVILTVSIFFIAYADDLLFKHKWGQILLYFPLYYVGIVAIPCFLFTWLIKWIFIGRYRVAQYPMWTWHVWKTEAVTSLYEALAVPFFLEFLRGTPFLPIFLRWMGAKIGHMTYIDSTDITEFDLVELGDYSAINLDAGPQTHLFEDRIMKIGSVKIGAHTSIGSRTIILFDTDIGGSCRIDALSLVMKGEKIPPHTSWSGIPIK